MAFMLGCDRNRLAVVGEHHNYDSNGDPKKHPTAVPLIVVGHVGAMLSAGRELGSEFRGSHENIATLLPSPSPRFLLPDCTGHSLSLIHISEPTRRTPISYAVFCL